MMINFKVSTPVIFDAMMLITSCENNIIDEWVSYFEKALIHKEVFEELKTEAVKNKVQSLVNNGAFEIVDDDYQVTLKDSASITLYQSCDRELQSRLDVNKGRDHGEYKTLLYAKFKDVSIFSTQEVAVWNLYTQSKNFKDIEFLTFQDLAFLMIRNGGVKEIRKIGKAIYKKVTNLGNYPLQDFLQFADSLNPMIIPPPQEFIPSFIKFKINQDSQ
ncbi:hypothetical protein FHE72_17370 [Rossellomorea vietnamensis]|uniref:Uncharacterized protein n=1 Tax=Rossellomorea vietnamensis TaxID=218284 RepID=A0A6I6UUV8_9BACI|nr:hypothetical protein [Rossellomorea vietnamensis]QHE62596.1 hypothetical protein FHE72_17370 [Rossellomorea vietnamensis]